jgi:hypothetical protein
MLDIAPPITAQLGALRDQLSQQLTRRGPEDPFVEHLRWQICCLERRMRRLDDRAQGDDLRSATPRRLRPALQGNPRGPQPG